jgi:ribonuclease-3
MFVDDLESIDINLKNKLIGWASKNGKSLLFDLVDEKREGNRRLFLMNVLLDGEVIASGQGYNKKDASQQAAQTALIKLGI